MTRLNSNFVLGYHGCDKEVGEALLLNEPFVPSKNKWDWLGEGVYFWEANPIRGLEFARQVQARNPEAIKEPFVVGAVLELGHCLDLCSSTGVLAVKAAYASFLSFIAQSGEVAPKNHRGDDLLLRELDCAVIMHLHEIMEKDARKPKAYETVKGLFREGKPIYENSGFYEQSHIQIAVREPSMIKGVFRVRDEDLLDPSLITVEQPASS